MCEKINFLACNFVEFGTFIDARVYTFKAFLNLPTSCIFKHVVKL